MHTSYFIKNTLVQYLYTLPAGPSIQSANLSMNYLRGMILSPLLTSEEGLPMLLGIQVLNQRIFDEIRGVHGLSYNPQAYHVNGPIRQSYSVIRVDTQSPAEVMNYLKAIIEKIKTEGTTQEELEARRSTYLTEYYLSEQTTAEQCNSLFMAILRGDPDLHYRFDERLNAVTKEEVEQVLNKYLTEIHWSYLGDVGLVEGLMQ